ncbi:MAG: substrate-binding domain-containing protein, partial [Planctomycetota bacterium]|nr:substrate-binding domain-containing protein [Planctomycetota bacterium]
ARFPHSFARSPDWFPRAIPFVHIGKGADDHHTFDVDRDTFIAGALAAARAAGRQRIAVLERHEHLRADQALVRSQAAALGLSVCPIPAEMPSQTLGYEAYGFDLLRRVWAGRPRPDALICPDDVIAKGVATAALGEGIDLSRQATLFAMVNRDSGIFYPAPMTTWEVDVETLVARAARTLIDLMNGLRVAPTEILMPPVAPKEAVSLAKIQQSDHAKSRPRARPRTKQ